MPGAPTPMPRIGWCGRARISSMRSWTRARAASPSLPSRSLLIRSRTSPRGGGRGGGEGRPAGARGEGPVAEVEGDDGASGVDERDEGRLLAAGAGAATDFLGEAFLLELPD